MPINLSPELPAPPASHFRPFGICQTPRPSRGIPRSSLSIILASIIEHRAINPGMLLRSPADQCLACPRNTPRLPRTRQAGFLPKLPDSLTPPSLS